MQLEIPLETVEYATALAYEYGKRVILNPAPASSLNNELLKRQMSFFLIASKQRCCQGIKVTNLKSAHRAVQAISCKGIENVVITLGKEGAFVKEKDKYIMIPAKEVDTIDTTGAGDVFPEL